MADGEHVSSTTPLFGDEVHHYQADPDYERPGKPKQDLFGVEDIVDLVGGAQDALDRHLAEASAPHQFPEFTEAGFAPEPVTVLDPVHVTEPGPVSVAEVKDPEPEPGVETAIPDSTSFAFVPDTPALIPQKPQAVAPKVEPESTKIDPDPEPRAAAAREPGSVAPESDALPAVESRKTAPAPAEASERPAVTEEPPAPASCESKLQKKSPFINTGA
ncbi:lysine-rich arabinogalactan protein 19-like, partial [Etheostoma cragini]|uniref:lysine-rich arabinogalactan protein 19-like n=1 Tax=Etheostoma cragini TaxID=417921 RepID=UPI00155E28C6